MGAVPSPASSQTAVVSGSRVYLYGGTNGLVKGDLSVLDLPDDLCSTRTTTDDCRGLLGCAACVVANDTSKLVFCQSNAISNLNRLERGYIEYHYCVLFMKKNTQNIYMFTKTYAILGCITCVVANDINRPFMGILKCILIGGQYRGTYIITQ